jgi:hypothetical protein
MVTSTKRLKTTMPALWARMHGASSYGAWLLIPFPNLPVEIHAFSFRCLVGIVLTGTAALLRTKQF